MMMSSFGSSARFIIGPVSILEIVPRNQGGYKTMQSLEPVINYLVDPNSGLKQVMTEFLNAVMLRREGTANGHRRIVYSRRFNP